MDASVGRREAERRIDEVQAIVAKMIRTEVNIPAHHELDDLIQDGMVGVFTHIDKWDPEISKFSNYVWLIARSYVFGHVLARDQYACHKINLMTLSLDAQRALELLGGMKDKRIQEIIRRRYTGSEKNQREIAKEMGITHQRVSQLERDGLRYLRRKLMDK